MSIKVKLRIPLAVATAVTVAIASHGTAVADEGKVDDSRTLAVVSPVDPSGEFISDEELDNIYPGGSQFLEHATFIEGLQELEASPIPRKVAAAGSIAGYTYILPEGQLTLPSSAAIEAAASTSEGEVSGTVGSEAGMEPNISVRLKGSRVAIGFNTTEQQMLGSGAAAALTVAICAFPFVGWLACGVASVAVAVGTAYVLRNGICSSGRTLWWYDVKGGSTIQCRSSRPF